MRVLDDQSAGGIVVRGSKILLISPRTDRWQLPKGHPENGESLAEAAVREVIEETGVVAEVVSSLSAIEYWYVEVARGPRRKVHKRVDFFLMQYRSGDVWHADAEEIVTAAWLTWDDALARLSFENERRVVEAARRLVEGGVADPVRG